MQMLKILIPIVLVHAGVLAVIVAVIKKMLLSDTMNAVGTIKQVEAEVRKKEETIRMEIDVHEKEFEKKKKEAETELDTKRKQSEKELASMKETIVAGAQKEGEKIMAQAKKNEEKFRQQLAQDMEEKAVDYAGRIFQLVASELVTPEINKKLIGELLDALSEVDAGTITVDGGDSNFISSHPIDEEQKKRLEVLIKEKFGSEITVQEKVDPAILGGLIMKLGSLEIDGSLRNRYQEAVAEVKKE